MDRIFILFSIALFVVIFNISVAAERYITISAPTDDVVLDITKPIPVIGTGKGLFEGNVVVRIETLDGKVLLQVATTLNRRDITAEGEWQVSITLPHFTPKKVKLIAFSPSPKEGDDAISSPPVLLDIKTQIEVELEEIHWQLKTYLNDSGVMTQVLPETIVDVLLNNGSISGNAGCNNYFGSYTKGKDKQLTIASNMGSTMMTCPPAISQQEHLYLAHLLNVTSWKIQDSLLQLLDSEKTPILEYAAIKSITLENTDWESLGINNGRAGVVSNITTKLSTAKLAKGKISGNTGCNRFSAMYKINGNRITIGPVRTTRKHCAEPDGIMEQEQQYLQALSQAYTFKLSSTRLEFRANNGSLQVSYIVQSK